MIVTSGVTGICFIWFCAVGDFFSSVSRRKMILNLAAPMGSLAYHNNMNVQQLLRAERLHSVPPGEDGENGDGSLKLSCTSQP